MKVTGFIPTWPLSCGHIIVSPIIGRGSKFIQMHIPDTMLCPQCEGSPTGLPNSEWSGGDAVPEWPQEDAE